MITINSINGIANYLELPSNESKSSFKVHNDPKDKLLINQNNIDKIYQEKFGIVGIDFLSNIIFNLHSKGFRYSPIETNINSQYRITLGKAKQDIYSYSGTLAQKYYVEGKTKDEYGRLISIIEFQNEIHGKLSNITKTIEKQLDSIKNQNTNSDEKGEKLKDKLTDHFMIEISNRKFTTLKNNTFELESLSKKLKVSLLNNKMFIQQANDLNIFCTQIY